MILIDNSVFSFAFQIPNGVPIRPFYDDPEDDELFHLTSYLKDVFSQDDADMRELNRKAFRLEELTESHSEVGSDEDIGGGEEEGMRT